MTLLSLKTRIFWVIRSVEYHFLTLFWVVGNRFIATKNIYCFTSYPDCSDNAWSFFKYLKDNNRTKATLVWLVQDIKRSRKIVTSSIGPNNNSEILVLQKKSLLGFWFFLRARHVFFTHGHYAFVKSTGTNKLVNLWHGMPIKAIGLLDNKSPKDISATDILIATSDFYVELMANAFNLRLEKVIKSGQPRCDELFSIPSLTDRLYERFSERKSAIVLWLPTYWMSSEGEIRNDGSRTVDEYEDNFLSQLRDMDAAAYGSNIEIVVKLHPMDVLNNRAWPTYESLVVFSGKDDFFDEVSLYSLLAASSGLITDVSSVAIDYLLTGKPLYLVWPEEEYTRRLLFDVKQIEPFCQVAYSYSGIGLFLEKVRSWVDTSNTNLENKLDNFDSNIFNSYIDGNNSARLAMSLGLLAKDTLKNPDIQ